MEGMTLRNELRFISKLSFSLFAFWDVFLIEELTLIVQLVMNVWKVVI